MHPILTIAVTSPNGFGATCKVQMYLDEGLKFTQYVPPVGSKLSPPMSLREAGATIRGLK